MYKIHIPTEQYGFVEVEVDSLDKIYEAYHDIKKELKSGDGLPPKEWNEALDRYLKGKGGLTEQWERMNNAQRFVIQEIKKANNRINNSEKS